MKAAAWIDKVKAKHGWESDYRVAKELDFKPHTISGYRSKADSTMDDKISAKVAESLGIDPAAVIIDQVAERSKDAAISAALHAVARSLCILC